MHDADDGDSDDNVGHLGLEEQYCKQARKQASIQAVFLVLQVLLFMLTMISMMKLIPNKGLLYWGWKTRVFLFQT